MTSARRLFLTFALVLLGSFPTVADAQTVPITKFFVAPETAPRAWVTDDTFNGGYVRGPMPDASDPPADQLAAGTHPNLSIFVRYCDEDPGPPVDPLERNRFGCTPDQFTSPNYFKFSLPPGLLGNPVNVPRCPYHLFLLSSCPPDTAIGETANPSIRSPDLLDFINVSTKIFNVAPPALAPAMLGTSRLLAEPSGPIPIQVDLRPDDFGIDSITVPFPRASGTSPAQVFEQRITIFGSVAGRTFLTNPTACKPAESRVEVTSWDAVGTPTVDESLLEAGKENSSFTPTNCGDVPFDPTLSIEPASSQAAAPTQYKVGIQFPPSEQAPIHQSHLRNATVTMPEGVSLSPAAGRTLKGCTSDQFGLGNDEPVNCPHDSQVGTVDVETPLLNQPLSGQAFFGQPQSPGQPTAANPWKLFMVIEGAGLRIKVSGDVTLNNDGRITTKFTDLPQTPFTRFDLTLNGGPNAVLANPRDCQPEPADITLVGWSGAVATPSASVQATGCSSPEPFAPAVGARAENEDAGAASPARLDVDRSDGNSLIRKLSLDLPPGLVGSLNAAPLCSPAEARAGSCGAASKVGSLLVTLGHGASLLEVTGDAYIAGPTEPGDVATFAIDIPAKVGPIDLGEVTVLNHVKLRQSDGGLTSISDPIPTILGGIPLPVKHIRIDIDRPNFLRNPTGCEPRQLIGSFDSDRNTSATASVSLSAKNCDRLPFAPRLRLVVPGGPENTHKGRGGLNTHTPLKAIVTQAEGEASIKRAAVKLPDPIRPDTVKLNRPGVLCSTAQLNIGLCPPQSRVGSATVNTPLLPEPLSGPVTIVQDPDSVLPKLIVQLRGMAAIDLIANNTIEVPRIVNTFPNVPDVPQSRFELNVDGGPAGILFNFRELCDAPATFDATFVSHSGKVHSSRPPLEVKGCGANVISTFSIASRRIKVDRRGVARVRVRCPEGGSCLGRLGLETRTRRKASKARRLASSARFLVPDGTTRTVRLRLRKSALRKLRKQRRMSAQISGSGGGKTVKRPVTLVQTKSGRAKRR